MDGDGGRHSGLSGRYLTKTLNKALHYSKKNLLGEPPLKITSSVTCYLIRMITKLVKQCDDRVSKKLKNNVNCLTLKMLWLLYSSRKETRFVRRRFCLSLYRFPQQRAFLDSICEKRGFSEYLIYKAKCFFTIFFCSNKNTWLRMSRSSELHSHDFVFWLFSA